MMTIERAFNGIWRVTRQRSVLQRVLIYWTLLTIDPLLIGASLSLTSWRVSVSLGLVNDIPGAAGSPIEAVAERIARSVNDGTGTTIEQLFAEAGAGGALRASARIKAG